MYTFYQIFSYERESYCVYASSIICNGNRKFVPVAIIKC